MKILIAEDNAFSRTLLTKTLSKAGYEVVAVEDGDAAWEVMQGDEVPRLALIDWMMPGMSGVDLCRKIRAKESAAPLYIILLTAKSSKDDVIEGFAAGADDFIKKPFDSGELLARIHVGRRLVDQHALLHCLIDSIPDPIYFKDNRGLYLGCNKAYEAFVGRKESEIINHTATDFLTDSEAQTTHMEDLRVLAGEGIENEGWKKGADGREVFLSTLKTPYMESSGGSSGMIAISRDLTRRIQMDQELKRLAVAVEQSTESIIMADIDGIIRYVNSAFEKISGYSAGDVIGKTPEFFRSEHHNDEFFTALLESISSGTRWEGRITSHTKEGEIFNVEAIIYPIRDVDGELMNYVAISRDVTQEMAVERRLRQTQKMNAIGELAGGVAHDFNNILTAILGYVALCMNAVEEESKVNRYLKEIVKAGDRASKLVRQILSFSRQEEQDFEAVELQPVIQDSVGMVQTMIKNQVKLELDVDEKCGPVFGESTQIEQVLVNLCTNALHALKGEDEDGLLKVSLRQVELLGKKKGQELVDLDPGLYACIQVEDTGCGMSAETIERIFEPYYTTKKKGEGTGFGLSIVHGIIQKHEGYITVDSELGAGTTFTIYLPLLTESVEAKEKAIDHATPEGFGHVLLVDDDDAVRDMGKELLESFGYSVSTAENGQHALDIFQERTDDFDVLVTDYSMPEMNGHRLISECLRIKPDFPAILCSGYREKAEGENLADLGHTAFISKPLDWRELSRIIQHEINKRA